METINSADEVIDQLGGTSAVALAVGASPKAVSNWRVRGLPRWTFLTLSARLKAKGLTAPPSLWRIKEPAE